ncbi:genetic competence negative regulator [Paenibacillus sp. TRM 82003]|nr:genetic competence negative regulator [Paenibacillus sp. TRM 82003]
MKIERLSHDKIRIFLTFDDLTERGIQKDDIWREIPRVHELFNDLMDHAYSEVGFDASGPLAVEVFAMPAQGMVVIVTKGKQTDKHGMYADEEEDVYEMEVTLEESDLISYTFHDFEHAISAAKRIGPNYTDAGALYAYQNKWILQLEFDPEDDRQFDNLVAVLSEYGEPNSYTDVFLQEYGKVVIAEEAVGVIRTRFS